MKIRLQRTNCPALRLSGQAGYTFVMAFFMILIVIIGSQAVLRNIANEGRRDREAEAIWRGTQFIRAIRIFYRKTGHYPQSLDDLQKGLPGMHFLRSVALKDPTNTDDGTWRLIYINAAGNLIGSTRYASLQQMALMDLNGGVMPAPAGSSGTPASDANAPDAGAQNPALNSNNDSQDETQQPGQTQTSAPATAPTTNSLPATNAQGGAGTTSFGASQGISSIGSLNQSQNYAAIAQQKPTGPVDGPVFGGLVTGVAGKIDSASIKIYKGGKTYQRWEFIWNPLEDQARALQNGLAPQQGQTQGQPGQPGLPGLPIANPNGGAMAPPDLQAPQTGQPQPQQPDQQQ